MGRLLIDSNSQAVLKLEKEKAEKAARVRHSQVLDEQKEASEHTYMQYLLIKIGRVLNYEVFVARNDHHRSYNGHSFALLTIPELPKTSWTPEVMDTVSLIDVIWLHPDTREIVAAFEVEKSTSIYSGILRMEDLARSIPGCLCHFYLLAPTRREKEVMAQFARPAFRHSQIDNNLGFITFEELDQHCDALCKFGEDHRILQKIARSKPLLRVN